MLNNNLLANRLNAYRQGSLKEDPLSSHTHLSEQLVKTMIDFTALMGKILMYGYTFRILLHSDWSFLSTSLIGLSTVVTLTYIYNLIHDKP